MNSPADVILIVEDDAQIRKFLRISLEAHGYTISESRLGADGLQLCATVKPNLVILDLGLPDMDGKEFIQRLREWSKTPVIVLSVRTKEEGKVEVLDAGANDYVTKPFSIAELMARIRVMLRTQSSPIVTQSIFECNGLRVDLSRHEISVDGTRVHLSNKEYKLLCLLISYAGQVLTHQQILKDVWGAAYQKETHYLRVLMGQLRQKLGDDPMSPRFIVTIQGVGYRLAV